MTRVGKVRIFARRDLRRLLAAFGALCLLVFCSGTGSALLWPLLARAEQDVRHWPHRSPEVIVVLGGDRYDEIARARHAAALQRRTGLPMLITGAGAWLPATLAAEQARVRWVESRATNTEENASYSAPLLRSAGVQGVYLVTDSIHMVRASILFSDQQFEVFAAPSSVDGDPAGSAAGWGPSKRAAMANAYMLHELIGLAWYRMRHGWAKAAGSTARKGGPIQAQ